MTRLLRLAPLALLLTALPASAQVRLSRSSPSVSATELPTPALRGGPMLILDDGSAEANIGSDESGSFLWFNRFTPPASEFPLSITSVDIFVSSFAGCAVGDVFDIYVWSDPDGNPDNGATLVGSETGGAITVLNDFTTSTFATPVVVTEPGDVLVGVVNRDCTDGAPGGDYPAEQDITSSQRRSYFAYEDDYTVGEPPVLPLTNQGLIDDEGFPGNWLIRASYLVPGAGSMSFCNSAPILAPANQSSGDGPFAPYPATVDVSGVPGTVTDVNVRLLDFSHELAEDLDIFVQHPAGQTVWLMSDAGFGISNVYLTFDDEASQPIPSGPIVTGSYKPANYSGISDTFDPPAPTPPTSVTLSDFDGAEPNGTWNLWGDDGFGGEVGSIAGGWCVDILFRTPPPPTIVVDTAAADQPYDAVASRDECTDGVLDGDCTLREAILVANADAALDLISFEVTEAFGAAPSGLVTFRPSSGLPQITDAGVTLDGTTQPGWVGATASTPATLTVELDGTGAPGTSGVAVDAPGAVVRGLVINRFSGYGVFVSASGANAAVEGCHLGTDVAGDAALGNGLSGVRVADAPGVRVGTNGDGTDDAAERNVIGGHPFYGVEVGGAGATGLVIAGNYIGVSAAGDAALGNGTGVILTTPGALVGTDGDGTADETERNVIAGNGSYGVEVRASGTVVAGNHIGVNAAGDGTLGNGLSGVRTTAPGLRVGTNTDGTADEAEANVIGGNGFYGVEVGGAEATGGVFAGNLVGTNAAGADLGNGASGLLFASGASANSSFDNTIRYNSIGIAVVSDDSRGNQFSFNAISNNDGLGIDIGGDGVTMNDAGDADGGPNGRQNYPVITQAMPNAAAFTLVSAPSTTYQVELYASAAADPSGYGEGARFVGTMQVTTDSTGAASGAFTFATVPVGEVLAATATSLGALDGVGSTSEFSAAVAVAGPPPNFDLVATNTDPPGSPIVVARGGSVTFSYSVANNTANPVTGDFWFTASRGGNTVAQSRILRGTVPAGQTVSRTFVQLIPGNAPPGDYTYTLKIGSFPNVAVDVVAFDLTITPASLAGGGESWAVTDAAPWGDEEASAAASSANLPTAFALGAAYPNPFSGRATLGFDVPEAADVRLVVYDVLGRTVMVLMDEALEAGRYEARLSGRDLPSGTYLARMTTDTGFAATQRLTLLR